MMQAGRDNRRGKRSMDDIDREILSLLTQDGRLSFRDLGAAVGLSSNAAADRVRRLRRDG
jgi:Lrp/AsnC family leucine-responsive transcriptional regulator